MRLKVQYRLNCEPSKAIAKLFSLSINMQTAAFNFIFQLLPLLYMIEKNMPVVVGVVGTISRLIHGIA